MRERLRDRCVVMDPERALIMTEAYKKYENVVPIIKRPLAFYELCKKMTLIVGDDELIVGNRGKYYFSSTDYPEWSGVDWMFAAVESGEWTLRDDGFYHNPDDEELKVCVSADDYKARREIDEYWRSRRVGTMCDAWQPDGFDELRRLNVSSYSPDGVGLATLPAGHLVAGYKKMIDVGYGAIRKQAQDWIDAHRGDLMGEDMDRYMFYKSAVIACDAASLLARRYAALLAEMRDACEDEKRKGELARMAESMEWLAENPARTFWEACQGVLLYQVVITMESRVPSPALGRFDQYTWPYLKADLEAGRITEDEAQELVDCFFLKANCFYNAGPAQLVKTTGIGNTYQHTTLGGVDPKTGEDATNPVTYMVLETMGRLGLHDPTISLRFNKNSPQKLWECAIATSKRVGGLPLYQNDEVIIPALMKEVGYSLEDARDFGVIGCQEIVGCGNDYPAPNGLHPPHATVLWASIFDMAINNGVNPFNGEQASLKTGYLYEMESIVEVRAAVEKMARYIMKLYVTTNNYAEMITQHLATQAPLSISIEGCMESGRDCVQGGAKYNSYGGTATGLATLADSLSTIKYMCFDKKLCTTRELYDAVMANWEGHERLRQTILAEVPHYGNADPYVDEELKWCCDLYYTICRECSSKRSKVYKSGLYGASDHIAQGKVTWATPDGRRTGEPIADAISPAQSRDKLGPTAIFESACCFDHHKFVDGMALNIRMHPNVLATDEGVEKLSEVTKTYFEAGGMEVQYNVVDTETLRAAQSEPEKYRDLVVRIAGYSAYFVELGRDLQNDIIARHENTL
jgi:formate C-acetyltransferase